MTINTFQKLEKIGEGTYGIVYKAKNKSNGEVVALKKIRPENENEGIPATTIREILLLKNLKHPNIIDLKEVIHSDNKMYLVFEYINSDLKSVIENHIGKGTSFKKASVRKMVYQLCNAVAFCHSKNIFHRDIKPQNILVDDNCNVKLADFGLGRAASVPLRSYTSEVVTLYYRAPEILLGSKYYDSSIDIWSLACIFYEIDTLNVLFSGDSEIDQLYKIFAVLGTPTEEVWNGITSMPNYKDGFPVFKKKKIKDLISGPSLSSLIEKMLQYDPMKRITAFQALYENYFKNMDTQLSGFE